jgi:uncharacterized protein YjbJ (UPF0337 family)
MAVRPTVNLKSASRAPEFKSIQGGNKMKPSTENEIKGTIHEVKGKVKETVGHVANDSDLETDGIGEKVAGKAQEKLGHAEKTLGK